MRDCVMFRTDTLSAVTPTSRVLDELNNAACREGQGMNTACSAIGPFK